MDDFHDKRLKDGELNEFFGRLFPRGFCGADVIQEIAPEGWESSPLLACFHPSPEQVFKEWLKQHRHFEKLRKASPKRDPDAPKPEPQPELTMEQVLAEWKVQPVNVTEEVTELVGRCLWDVFADNHDVIAADGRLADLGSFRAASAFLEEYLAGRTCERDLGGYRFYMGSVWISRRADLTPVYRMIFRRLRSLGADWKYHFPRLYLVDLSPLRQATENQEGTYSPSRRRVAVGRDP